MIEDNDVIRQARSQAIDDCIKAIEAMPVVEGEPDAQLLQEMANSTPIVLAEAAGNITKRRILRVVEALKGST